MSKSIEIRTYSKQEFSQLYLVDWRTIKSKVKDIDFVLYDEINDRSRTLLPNIVRRLFEAIGEP